MIFTDDHQVMDAEQERHIPNGKEPNKITYTEIDVFRVNINVRSV